MNADTGVFGQLGFGISSDSQFAEDAQNDFSYRRRRRRYRRR